MGAGLLLGVLRARAELRSREHWSRDALLEHQARSLQELRRYAVDRSPFYRELHRGLENAPLEQLPIVTKQALMERFDDLVTDRAIQLADVEAHLRSSTVDDLFRGTYRVAVTGGTTGRRGIFLADPTEWRTVLASYSRAYDWAGLAVGLTRWLRMAVVASLNPSHQSAMVGASLASRLLPALRLDATAPLDDIVAALNDFRPDVLIGYASMLRILAGEQAASRLKIEPRGVMSASEVLTDETRAMLRSAFGLEPTNVYAATETAGIASECRAGRMHRYEDLVIAEIVDADNQPVTAGEFGSKLLVTVLFSRTQPLIRYEMSDRVAASVEAACPDGRPFSLLAGIEGREEEVLTLGGAIIHPNVFHAALEALPVAGWQVVEESGQLRVLVAATAQAIAETTVESRLREALERAGAHDVSLKIEIVDAIARTALGKTPLIVRSGGGDLTRSPSRI